MDEERESMPKKSATAQTTQTVHIKSEPQSASVSISCVPRLPASKKSLTEPSVCHSVSVTSITTSKTKTQERPNVIFTSVNPRVSGATSSLEELTISPAYSPHSTVIQSTSDARNKTAVAVADASVKPTSVSVIRRASLELPAVSVESVTFKTPPPVKPLRTTKASSDSLKPSVSVSVVKSGDVKKPATTAISINPQSDTQAPSVKIASFAKEQQLNPNLTVKARDKRCLQFNASTAITSSVTSLSHGKKVVLSSASASSSVSRDFILPPKRTDSSHAVEPDTEQNGCISEDEEEILVYVQFDSQLDSDVLQPETPLKLIGLSTERPVLQLGDQVFEGNWHDTIGTAVFFEEDSSNALAGDPVFTKIPEQPLKYHSKTRKSLQMSRIFIKPKAHDTTEPETDASVQTVPIEESAQMDTEESMEQEPQID